MRKNHLSDQTLIVLNQTPILVVKKANVAEAMSTAKRFMVSLVLFFGLDMTKGLHTKRL